MRLYPNLNWLADHDGQGFVTGKGCLQVHIGIHKFGCCHILTVGGHERRAKGRFKGEGRIYFI